VVGETPNLAARLQALADPGAVVIADSCSRLDHQPRGFGADAAPEIKATLPSRRFMTVSSNCAGVAL
jgi:class 3 adenylate cyclase